MEIIFTSLKQAAHALLLKKVDWALLDIRRFGWFLSTVQPFLFRLFMTAIDLHWLFRALIYGVLIIIVEFISGFVIKLLVEKSLGIINQNWPLPDL